MQNTTFLSEIGTTFDYSGEALGQKDIEQDVLKNLNNLIVVLNVNHPRVSSLLHISSNIYPSLFEKVFGYKPIDLISYPKTAEDEAHNVQCVIDTLSLDILGVSLSHITGEDIVARKHTPIFHLLEIISEFVKAAEMQFSRSSISVSVPGSESSSVSSSNASHREHFCPICEYGLTKAGKTRPVDSSESSICHSCSLHVPDQDKENSQVDVTEVSNSLSHSSRSASNTSERQSELLSKKVFLDQSRKMQAEGLSFNEKLSERLVQNLERLNRDPEKFFNSVDVSLPDGKTSLNHVYKSVFQRNLRKRLPTHEKETSVLLPRYLKRRRTTSKTQPTSSKKLKVQPSAMVSRSTGGVLEEIKSEVPAAHFSQEGLNVLGLNHKRQVKLLSSRLSSMQNKISTSRKMLHENITKQAQLAELEEKDLERQEKLRNMKSLRNDHLKIRGAIQNNNIQRARLKRYFDQYHFQHKRKLSNREARGEMIVRDLYKSRLARQKQQVIDLSKDLRDQERDEAVRLGNRMASVQNLYLGKTERLKKHAEEHKAQKQNQMKAQQQVLEKTRKAILKQIENEVQEIQSNLERQDDFHFVESDAERLKEHWSRPL